ncbi:Glycosyltransferase family 92 protein, partial [Trichostrongylus colubriformis]
MLLYNGYTEVNVPHPTFARGLGTLQNANSRIGTTPEVEDAMIVTLEQPLRENRHDLVVCMAPMYIYTDWETLLVGIETWLALGATKIIVPVQSASTSSYRILQEYEKRGLVIIRNWPKWPVLSDSNPNGLVLSR